MTRRVPRMPTSQETLSILDGKPRGVNEEQTLGVNEELTLAVNEELTLGVNEAGVYEDADICINPGHI
jgi:hypothetical protein